MKEIPSLFLNWWIVFQVLSSSHYCDIWNMFVVIECCDSKQKPRGCIRWQSKWWSTSSNDEVMLMEVNVLGMILLSSLCLDFLPILRTQLNPWWSFSLTIALHGQQCFLKILLPRRRAIQVCNVFYPSGFQNCVKGWPANQAPELTSL